MSKKVLVVDDEKEIVDFMEKFLGRFNLVVVKATGGVAALDLYDKEIPAWVFLDICMPDKDGLTVLKEMKKRNSRCKVIMLTARDDKKSQDNAKKYGAVDYITKPIDLEQLRRKINKYVL
ncbi:MAG: response regulator [Candidatus Omnitrophota bacterium]